MLNPIQIYKAHELTVRVCASADILANDAAGAAQACLRRAIAEKGRAAAILATGNSQIRFLERLTAAHGIDWGRVTLFHMDEYLGIDAGHAASFRRYLRERVEEKVRPLVFNYLEGNALEPMAECRRYAALLARTEIDLCCMGIGENGHLAFNDPAVAQFDDAERVKLVRLDEACRLQQVGEGHFAALERVPQYALTLTIPALLDAAQILCIVPEQRKAAAVRAALQGPLSTSCPASILRTVKQATLYLDEESAGGEMTSV